VPACCLQPFPKHVQTETTGGGTGDKLLILRVKPYPFVLHSRCQHLVVAVTQCHCRTFHLGVFGDIEQELPDSLEQQHS